MSRTNRRQFLSQTTAAVSGVLCFPALLRSASPNSLLHVACIGVGGRGASDMKGVSVHPKVKLVALCDVDGKRLDTAAKGHPDAAKFKDWRELFSGKAPAFDALTIGVPDHMHAPIAVTAIRARKHVYLEKPMASNLHECRVITQEAAKHGVVSQLGNQGRSSMESRMAVELIRSGAIGKIKEVILFENKPLIWWPKNTELRPTADPLPAGLDWDLWLGVREPRPYLANTYHPQTWRAWLDFGSGELGDMGCHHFDTTFDALKLTAPLRVRQTTPGSTGPLWGKSRIVEFIFAGTSVTAGDTVQLTWHDGELRPDASRIKLPSDMAELPRSGTYWIGEKGSIFKQYGGGRPVVLPEADFPDEKYPKLKPQEHHADWVDAILEGRRACDDFSHGGPLTETVLVGSLADRFPNQWLEWDRAGLAFKNCPEANKMIRRPYRDGWKIEGLA